MQYKKNKNRSKAKFQSRTITLGIEDTFGLEDITELLFLSTIGNVGGKSIRRGGFVTAICTGSGSKFKKNRTVVD